MFHFLKNKRCKVKLTVKQNSQQILLAPVSRAGEPGQNMTKVEEKGDK